MGLSHNKALRTIVPLSIFAVLTISIFGPFFHNRKLPIPADIIAGVYYPWLDYNWGYPTGVPVKNPLLSDIPSILYPWRELAMSELKQGRIPLWNPYYFFGLPLLANFQSAVFSPANVFFLFLEAPLAWSWGIIASFFLSLIAMWLFLNGKNLSLMASISGAVIFSLSGFMTAWLEYNVHAYSALFLPLTLWLIDMFVLKKNRFAVFCIPLAVCLSIFSGYLPIVIYSFLAYGLYLLYLLVNNSNGTKTKTRVFVCGGALIFGLVMASIQLLPGIEMASLSIRRVDPIVTDAISYLRPVNLIGLFAPDYFGNPATYNYFGRGFYDNFYLFIGFPGLVLVLLTVVINRSGKEVLFWWIIVGLALLLALDNPVGRFLSSVFRLTGGVAARSVFLLCFSLAVLAAYGFDSFFRRPVHRSVLVVTFIISLILLVSLNTTRSFGLVQQVISRRNLILPIASVIVAILLLLISRYNKLRHAARLLFVIIVVAPLVYSAHKYLPFSDSKLLFPTTPVLKYLQDQQQTQLPFRVELGDVIPQNMLLPYRLSTTSGYDTLLPLTTGYLLNQLQTGFSGNAVSRVHLLTNYQSSLFPLTATRYLLAKKIDSQGKYAPNGQLANSTKALNWKIVFDDKTISVLENPNYIPPVFLVYHYTLSPSITNLPTTNYQYSIVLAKPPTYEPDQGSSGTVEWRTNQPGNIELDVTSSGNGLLFWSQTYSPGWHVFVDSKPAEILKANNALQAVSLPLGRHHVVFNYIPWTFQAGAFISMLTVLLWLITACKTMVNRYTIKHYEKNNRKENHYRKKDPS